jgi:hypothetical protein
MSTTQRRHLDADESLRVKGPAEVHIKKQTGNALGEHDKEGLLPSDMQDKLQGTWEELQLKGGKVLETVQQKGSELLGQVKGQAANLQSKAAELTSKAKGQVDEGTNQLEDDEGFQEVHYRGKKKLNKTKQQLNQGLDQAKGKLDSKLKALPSQEEVKSRLARLLNRQSFDWQDLLAYLVPLIVLALALTAGIAAYRSYMAPPQLPPATTLEGLKARANLWGTEAYDYVHDKGEGVLDYATEKASLLSDQLKSGVGVYSDKAKETMWKARDQAAEQANSAYREAAKKASEAKKLADLRSREALADLKNYAKVQTKPEGFMDKLSNKLDDLKDSLARKTGLMSEEAKHKANLAAEQARHAAEEARYKAADTGLSGKLKHAAHDLKESVKAKIHPHI